MSSDKKVAIIQSNYIPWKGYFDMINMVDEFILYDDVQYTKRDWRNRNKIKTKDGLHWLTIPVHVEESHQQKIKTVEIADESWNSNHWKTIKYNAYGNASYFGEYKSIFKNLYMNSNERRLSEINYKFLNAICDILGIETDLNWSMDYEITSTGKTERLVDLCIQAGANEYLSGPSAKDYMEEGLFREEGIQVTYMDYSGYPEYEQLFPPFEHKVSIIDLIFNEGPNATEFMKSFT